MTFFNKKNIVTAISIGVFWWLLSIAQTFYELAVVTEYQTKNTNFKLNILLKSTLIVILAGTLAGLFIIPLVRKWLRKFSYIKAIILTLLSVTILFTVISLIGSIIYNVVLTQKSILSDAVLSGVTDYFFGIENLKNYLFWLFVGFVTIISFEIDNKYGPGNFTKFLFGNYFHPKTEQRIFMFLDIKSATTIAEKLGEIKFFNFLKDFFNDITSGILISNANVYQYVGDEVILTWDINKHNAANCLKAFFTIKNDIALKSTYYEETYNVVPQFKVGLHYGEVVVGEIGVIKKDISFLGDVVNTASRIQNMCNQFNVDILLSEKLKDLIENQTADYQFKMLEKVSLKGKVEEIKLFTL